MSWPDWARLWYSRRHWPFIGVTIEAGTGNVRPLRYARFRSAADGLAWVDAMQRAEPLENRRLYGLRNVAKGDPL